MVKYTLWGTAVDLDLSKKTFPTDDEIKKIDGLFVNCDHGFFDSSIGAKLHFRICSPTNGVTPKGICVFLHGIHGYSGLGCEIDGDIYKHPLLFNRLAEDGYIVYALDMQGHGFSEGKRFVIPYSDYKINRDDFASFASFVSKEENPSLPLFLMGESYGACLAIHTARLWMDSPKKCPSNFKGFCVLAPAIVGDLPPPPVVAILTALAAFFPTWAPFFMPDTISNERMWKDEEIMKEFTSDRRKEMRLSAAGGSKFCLGTAFGLVEATKDIREKVIPGLSVPFYACHGTDDYGVPVAGTEYLMEHASTPEEDRCVNIIEGERHDLLTEGSREETAASMIDWMNSRIEK